ncbi:carboxypeptidase-like regulatory domain-containing protein [Candidatus Cyanaurora vandensis]|uniref:carboxypeptidase-like regulatory domain-containing protein n=1 Tax=Candidatus Cyanaurora vandensis TaxID=2714958 RepID=UPI002580A111|nr:carboxypeptidase-like regulatory domain-containing protein [Candidatus Cyanaurora vandensis]
MRVFMLSLLALTLALPVQAEAVYGRVYETLQSKVFANTRVVLLSDPKQETTTDSAGAYWFRNVKPGAYLVQIFVPDQETVVGRLIVYPRPTTIVNLDLSIIEDPHHDDEY